MEAIAQLWTRPLSEEPSFAGLFEEPSFALGHEAAHLGHVLQAILGGHDTLISTHTCHLSRRGIDIASRIADAPLRYTESSECGLSDEAQA